MKSIGSHSILTSAQRLVEGEQKLKEAQDPIWIGFLKRESNILLRRTFKVWWQLRFQREHRKQKHAPSVTHRNGINQRGDREEAKL